ncbi:hypothetical protein PQR75_44835 [Paraburkholderia fungorum]|uniref:hypothetical protein n=1 Tax=Paraburkholderia fungorum TaxID=134537 RepID=UPI0038BDDE3E
MLALFTSAFLKLSRDRRQVPQRSSPPSATQEACSAYLGRRLSREQALRLLIALASFLCGLHRCFSGPVIIARAGILLEEAGIITKYASLLDQGKVGFPVTAYVQSG